MGSPTIAVFALNWSDHLVAYRRSRAIERSQQPLTRTARESETPESSGRNWPPGASPDRPPDVAPQSGAAHQRLAASS
jgi:hypothetical protein